MFAVEFERPSGRLAFTIVLLALSSKHALAQTLWMFPRFRRAFPKFRVQEVIAAAWMHTVGFKDFDAALAEIGKLHTIEPSPALLRSAKRAVS